MRGRRLLPSADESVGGEVGVVWTGSFSVPKWALVIIAGVVLLFAPVLAALGITAIERLAAFDRAAERRLLDLKVSQLALQPLAPGSALACLDGIATEALASGCERALFSTPHATTAAISYVAAQISLLEAAKNHEKLRAAGVLANIQRALETDRFGFVAHVLASSYGCTALSCDRLGLFHDARRVKSNLAEGLFATTLKKCMDESNKVAESVTGSAQAPTTGHYAKPSTSLYIPSAASIPAVSIMVAEPGERKETSEATTPSAPQARKPPPAKESKAGVTVNGRAKGAPLQLSPGAQ